MKEFMATEVSVSTLIDKLLSLQDQQRIVNPRKRIDGAIPKLQQIQELLKHAASKKERDSISEWMVQLLRAVYQAEDSIDTFLVSTISLQQRHGKLFTCGLSAARRGILFRNEIGKFMNQVTGLSSDDGFSRLQGLRSKDLGQKLTENATGREPSSRNGEEGSHQSWGRISHHLGETSKLIGPMEDIESMLHFLVDCDKVVLVIVGTNKISSCPV